MSKFIFNYLIKEQIRCSSWFKGEFKVTYIYMKTKNTEMNFQIIVKLVNTRRAI